MIGPLVRKARQLLEDPVLRMWLYRRALRLEPPEPGFVAGQPPYLRIDRSFADRAAWQDGTAEIRFEEPSSPTKISLAGAVVCVRPETPEAFFRRTNDDLETMLSAHRFAWVPVAGEAVDGRWVAALWTAWMDGFSDRAEGWPWHPYTAAERAINIIDFARRRGLPGDAGRTVAVLARHAEAIASSLEYFGDHYTSNHLANNGRGLLRIGTALGLGEAVRMGTDILVAEGDRIFGPAGMLREGSSHYHLLLARNYLDAWLESDRAALAAAPHLREIAGRALRAAQRLRMSGGVPTIGDISPDCPPDFLAALADPDDGGATGWVGQLDPEQRSALDALRAEVAATDAESIGKDGWNRFGTDGWEAMTFVPRDGWVPMPGHGHQDLGAFELHCGSIRVVVDPGRGSYAVSPADRFYQAATAHSGLTIDGVDPAPVNRPYYSDAFRVRIVPEPPAFSGSPADATLTHGGYRRLRGVGRVSRRWRISEGRVSVADRIDGSGARRIARRIVTPYRVAMENGSAVIDAGTARFRVAFGSPISLEPITCWTAYGMGFPGTVIASEQHTRLPFEATINIERL